MDSKRKLMPRAASRFFRWWFCGDVNTRSEQRMRRESNRCRGTVNINVSVQPIGDMGNTHNPDLPGARWVEPLPTFDDAQDSWDDAVYLGASWEHFVDVDAMDPFTPNGHHWARVDLRLGNEHRWGRLS